MATPPADSFRLPHIQRLAKTPKVNPVHEAHRGTSPPVHAPLQPEMPEWLGLEKGWVLVKKNTSIWDFTVTQGVSHPGMTLRGVVQNMADFR